MHFRKERTERKETRHLPKGSLPKTGQLSRIRANAVLDQGDDPAVKSTSLSVSAPSDEQNLEMLPLFPGQLPPRAAEGKPSIQRTGAWYRSVLAKPPPCSGLHFLFGRMRE